MRKYDFITFDCYGTLIDWEEGIRRAFILAAHEDGIDLDTLHLMDVYTPVESVVERESYRPYRDVLTEAATRTAQGLGWRLAYERATFLITSLPSWPPFADTNRALEKLRAAGYKLGILSNVDDDLLEATRRHFTVDFDLIVTAQQVGSYKPAPMHFLTARERIGNMRWLHVAQSNYHDIVPANALGIANAWINRKGDVALPGGRATHEFRNLDELAEAMV